MPRLILALLCCALLAPSAARAQNPTPQAPYATERQPVALFVDASRAAEGLMFVRERIPATPGEFTIVYPKWIPGEHGPTGPLNDLAELRVSANGSPLEWHRDATDLYAFHLTVPPGATSVDVSFTVLMNAPGDHMSSHSVAVVNWNRALLYQEGIESRHYFVKPAIALPAGWDYATALRGASRNGDRIDFSVTPLEMLVDSPLDMGAFVRKWDLCATVRRSYNSTPLPTIRKTSIFPPSCSRRTTVCRPRHSPSTVRGISRTITPC